MRNDICFECGSLCDLKPYTHKTQVGRYTVSDSSCDVFVCKTNSKHINFTLDEVAHYELAAAGRVLQSAEIGSAEIKFARKAMGFLERAISEAYGASYWRWYRDVHQVGG